MCVVCVDVIEGYSGDGCVLASTLCKYVIFAMFYYVLDMSCGECNVISLYVLCCSVNGSVRFVWCVSDSACELFGETIRNMFWCGCYFVVECCGVV